MSLVLIPHVTRIPFWISLVAGCALLIRAMSRIDLRRVRARILLTLIVMITTAGVYFEHGTLLGLQSGVSLFVLMLSFKTLETRNLRDGMLVTCLSCFMLITHFFYTQSIPVTLYAIAVAVIIPMTLMQLNKRNAALSYAYRFRFAGTMLLQSIPLMLILFILFPRLSGPLWALPDDAGSGITGLSDSMSPGQISSLTQSDKVAFRVEFEGEPPPSSRRYWRGPVLWNFDGQTWRAHASAPITQAPSDIQSEDIIRYEVTLEPHGKQWLFALDIPDSIPSDATLNGDYQLLLNKPLEKRIKYQMVSNLDYTIGRDLNSYERHLALRLPKRGAAQARQLASEWRRNANSDPQRTIEQALEFFSKQNFFYTLTPQPLGRDPVDAFLFNTREGFCEHYASSFVVLMRAAGLPARVVTGYSGGEWNPLGNYMLIRQADAHAWAEVWLQNEGWVRVDPTAAVAPERILTGISSALRENSLLPMFVRASHAGSWLNRLNLAMDNVNFQWNAWVLSYGPDRQQALLSWLGHDAAQWQVLIVWMVTGISAFMVAYTLAFFWNNRITPTDPLVRAYERLSNKLTSVNLPRLTAEGPIEYARRIRAARPDIGDLVEPVLQHYARLRYSSYKDDKEIDLLRRRIRKLRIK